VTWHTDQTQGRPEGSERDKLLEKRAALVKQVEVLSMQPLTSKTEAAKRHRQEDLLELARKIKVIDKKLGRIT